MISLRAGRKNEERASRPGRYRPAIVLAFLLAFPLPALATLGDVVPRPAGDGLTTAADLVWAIRARRADETPTGIELRRLDAGEGLADPEAIDPPTWNPRGDGALGSDDLDVLRDVVLGRVRLPDGPGLLLRRAGARAVRGLPFETGAVLSSRSLEAVTYSVEGAPAGLAIDATTGDIAYVPGPSDGDTVAFTLVATQGGRATRADAVVRVTSLTTEAEGVVGAPGGTLEVEAEFSAVLGLTLLVPPGAVTTDATFEIGSLGADWGGASGRALTPPLALVTNAAAPLVAEISLPVPAGLPEDPSRLAWDVLAWPVAECDGSVSAVEARPAWADWIPADTTLREGRVVASVLLGCDEPAFVRLVARPEPPTGCATAAATAHVTVEVRDCPTNAAVTANAIAQQFERAFGGCAALGFAMPEGVRVVVESIERARDAFVDPLRPDVVHVDRGLDPARLRVVAAHEMLHVAQLHSLSLDCREIPAAWRYNAFALEGTAAWLERVLLDEPTDPSPADLYTSRLFAEPGRRSLDALGPEAWLFFDFLDTALGIGCERLFTGEDGGPDLGTPGAGLLAVDELLSTQGDRSLAAVYPDFLHELNVARLPERLAGIDELGLPEPVVTTLDASVTEAAPATLCGLLLPHVSGVSWILDVPESLDDDAAMVLRVDADGEVDASLYSVASGSRERRVAPNTTISTGRQRGTLALHVVNTSLADGPPVAVDVTAWVVPEQPYFADTDGDDWPDVAEAEVGTDPDDAASEPVALVPARGAARVYVPATDDPADDGAAIVPARGAARVIVPGTDDPVDIDVPIIPGRGAARVYIPGTDDPVDIDVPIVPARGSARVYIPATDDPVDIDVPIVPARGAARVFIPATDDTSDTGTAIHVARPHVWVEFPPE